MALISAHHVVAPRDRSRAVPRLRRRCRSRSASTLRSATNELPARRLLGDLEQERWWRRPAPTRRPPDCARGATSTIAAVAADRRGVGHRGAAELEDDHGAVEQPAGRQQFGVQDRRAGRAANDVVRHRHELHVEHADPRRTRPTTTVMPWPSIAVATRLRPIRLVAHHERRVRARVGSPRASVARHAIRAAPPSPRPAPALRSNSTDMQTVWPCSTGTRLACAVTANGAGRMAPGAHVAEHLVHLDLDLRLLVADERDDVAEDVEAGHAGIAGARDGLHGGHEQPRARRTSHAAAPAPWPPGMDAQLALVTIAPVQPRRCALGRRARRDGARSPRG